MSQAINSPSQDEEEIYPAKTMHDNMPIFQLANEYTKLKPDITEEKTPPQNTCDLGTHKTARLTELD